MTTRCALIADGPLPGGLSQRKFAAREAAFARITDRPSSGTSAPIPFPYAFGVSCLTCGRLRLHHYDSCPRASASSFLPGRNRRV